MQCISINYRHADISIRERSAFSEARQTAFLRELCGSAQAQCVILCTCNRTEVYSCCIPEQTVSAALAEYSGIPGAQLLPHLRTYTDEKAIRHLFGVACGLHSMVLGEDEILRQIKEAYRTACDCRTVGYELHRIFQAAITCAKRIKTETPLSVTPVSIATLAANEAAHRGNRILVIGATGQIGTSTVKNLLSHKNVQVTATLRSHGGDLQIADRRILTGDYAERYRLIAGADCVISATSSPHYTVTLHELQRVRLTKPLLFLDLAVPPDIDPAVTQLPGVSRRGIDDFRRLAQENQDIRTDSAEAAKQMIAQEADALRSELAFHTFLPAMERVCTKMQEQPEQILYRMKAELRPETLTEILHLLEAL